MNTVEQALQTISRAMFLPPETRPLAGVNAPLAIGYGQTNSQPEVVAMMLEWLNVEPGQLILDVGAGSGWTTALLAHIAGPKGKLYAVERIPELVDFGRDNVERAGLSNTRFFQAGDQYGLPEHAPYDRILVSAAAEHMPLGLLEQLRPEGIMVIPVRNDILVIYKDTEGTPHTQTHSGFSFVPLVKD